MKTTLELVSQLYNQHKAREDHVSLDDYLDRFDWIDIKFDRDFDIKDWLFGDKVLQAKCLERIVFCTK